MPVTKLELEPRLGNVMVRHNELIWGVGALVFIHGLGESRGMFMEAFEDPRFEGYNLMAMDLPGSGNSPGGLEFSLSAMIHCVETVIRHFNLTECILVGHGMGADIALWLSQRRLGQERVRGVVAIEASLGDSALELGNMAIEAADDPARTYSKWFRHAFAEEYIRLPNMGKDAYRRFNETLLMCRPSAYLTLAREQQEKLYTQGSHELSTLHALTTGCPKLYCLAGKGYNHLHEDLLKTCEVPYLVFREASHWLMIDDALAFYAALARFSSQNMPARSTSERMKAWFFTRFRNWLDRFPRPLDALGKLKHFIYTRIKRKIR